MARYKSPPTAIEPAYFSKKEAAIYTGTCERSLDAAVERGDLIAYRVRLGSDRARKLLFRRTDLDLWIQSQQVAVDLDAQVAKVVAEAGR